jgi:uracil phosphoribosyltransferase
MLVTLSETNSIANHFIAELRDIEFQKDRMRFRKNLERLGEIMAYEISKTLDYQAQNIQTPLGISKTNLLVEHPVIVTILRAGLPFYNGFLNFFDKIDSGFVGAYRVEGKGEIEISTDYMAAGSLSNKTLMLVDPMLATGKSLVSTMKKLLEFGEPSSIHLVSAIAAPEGINYINENFDRTHTIWTGAVDEKLDENSYIAPGLGDAGDLSFGPKL